MYVLLVVASTHMQWDNCEMQSWKVIINLL